MFPAVDGAGKKNSCRTQSGGIIKTPVARYAEHWRQWGVHTPSVLNYF